MLTVVPEHWYSWDFRVLQEGDEVARLDRAGAIRPVSPFRRTAVCDLPDSIPLPVRLFLIFLALVLWKRQSDAAST